MFPQQEQRVKASDVSLGGLVQHPFIFGFFSF